MSRPIHEGQRRGEEIISLKCDNFNLRGQIYNQSEVIKNLNETIAKIRGESSSLVGRNTFDTLYAKNQADIREINRLKDLVNDFQAKVLKLEAEILFLRREQRQ